MNVVNNYISPLQKEIEAGDILEGTSSGDYYLVLDDTIKVLNLRTLIVNVRIGMSLSITGIKKENITITFEGAK